MNMIESLLVTDLFAFLLVFTRLGTGIMMLPGYAETYVIPRSRLSIALAISALLMPILRSSMPAIPGSPLALIVLIVAESLIGLFIGIVCRLLVSTMHVAGQMISFQIGLSTATMFDFNQATQGSLLGNLLSVTAVIMLFVTDLHHLMLRGLVESYSLFPAGQFPPVEDMANLVSHTVSETFLVALKLTSPFLVIALLVNLCGGILSRLMPMLQMLSLIAAPQIMVGLFLLMATLGAVMSMYLNYFGETLATFLQVQ